MVDELNGDLILVCCSAVVRALWQQLVGADAKGSRGHLDVGRGSDNALRGLEREVRGAFESTWIAQGHLSYLISWSTPRTMRARWVPKRMRCRSMAVDSRAVQERETVHGA